MHRGIATVSLSGRLGDKLDAVAAAGFDGIELFDNDLVSSDLSPAEVARRCADLGLSIDLFQPVRDVEGVPPERFDAVLRRFATKLGVMAELGATTVLCCSNAGPDAVDDPDLSAAQLARLGDLAADAGVTIAYEALAWGRHVSRVGQSWEVVRRADHPAVTLAVDTFHMLSRGDDGAALAGVPGDRIGFLQVADAPALDMDVLEWSRHFRCFPGQGTLDVTGVVAATLEAGYRGPLSLEVFSDVVREADPQVTARDAMRSLIHLEDRLAGVVRGDAARLVSAAPAPARRTDAAFVELAATAADDPSDLLTGLGFTVAGRHRTKQVTWWSQGGAHVVVNHDPVPTTLAGAATALGVVAPPVASVAARADALLWPALARTRGDGEARLPGITAPSGVHVFVSAEPGDDDSWRDDFEPADAAPSASTWVGLDHVGIAVPSDVLNEEVSFHRTLLGLEPGRVEEFMEPHGRLRSRALRPSTGDLRVVLNVADTSGSQRPRGITQLAFSCTDLRAEAVRLREAGVPLMAVPDNYYVDLVARFGLDDDAVADLRDHGLLYDRIGDGEFLHLYTPVLGTGFYVELLERRGGYDGYGQADTHVRLAAQSR
ncbi:TIM barrel protein [Solicola sp. PLA-1-18]|uniref:sugar phosphate isomerase/epimerase and 4-hydroxyphenylpyruvate domain-containing protein n=1 Tax=Solicola sp. PLA-1-18 TaxID=3380532 RepID=UPI003B7AEB0C